jgi:hypothetical protein
MSRLTELKNQYEGYVAASEAVKKTDPGIVEVVYCNCANRDGEGFFRYYPEKNNIEIIPHRSYGRDSVRINANDVPALIKALREFFE